MVYMATNSEQKKQQIFTDLMLSLLTNGNVPVPNMKE